MKENGKKAGCNHTASRNKIKVGGKIQEVNDNAEKQELKAKKKQANEIKRNIKQVNKTSCRLKYSCAPQNVQLNPTRLHKT